MSGGGKGGSNQTVAYYYAPVAMAICEGPIIGIKQMWAGGNLIFSDSQPVAVNSYHGGGKKSGPTVSTSYQQFGSSTTNDTQTGGSALGSWTCYLGTETQPADPTIGEGVAYRGVAYIVFPALNIGPGATIPPLTFEVVREGELSAPYPMWEVYVGDSTGGIAFDGNGNPLIGWGYNQSQYGFMRFSAETGEQIQNYVQGTMPYNFNFSNGFAGLSQPGGVGADVYSIIGGKYVSLGYSPNAPQPYYNGYLGAYGPTGGVEFGPGAAAGFPGGSVLCDGTYLLYGEQDDSGSSHLQCLGIGSDDINPLLQINTPGFFGNFSPFVSQQLTGQTQYFINGIYYAIGIASFVAPSYTGGLYSLQVGNFGANDSEYPVLLSSLPTVFCLDESGQFFWVGYSNSGKPYIQQMNFDGNLIAGTGFEVSSLPNYLYSAYSSLFLISGIEWNQYSLNGNLLNTFSTQQNYSYFANNGDGTIYAQAITYLGRISVRLVITPSAMTLPAAVTILCERAGIQQFDVSQLPATPVNFVRGDTVTARSMLQRLSQAYFFSMVDSGGILKFVPYGLPSAAVIPLEDLGFDAVKPNAVTPFTSSRISGVDLPRSVKIRYISPALNWEKYEQIFALESYDSGKEITLDLPLILDDQTAYNIAALACTLPHAEREQYAFTTSYKWLALEPGDVVTLPFGTCRILTVRMGQKNGLPVLDFTVCIDGMNALAGAGYAKPALPDYTPGAGGVALVAPSNLASVQVPGSATPHPIAAAPQIVQTVPNAGVAKLALIEPPPLSQSDTGMRFYAGAYTTGNAYPGVGIFQSTDGGTTYNQILTLTGQEAAGYANSVLPAPSGIYNNDNFFTWDQNSTVDIYPLTGSGMQLSGLPDINVLNGGNAAMLGSELIQFGQAVLKTDAYGNPYYTLSRLLRGRRGTEWAMGTHTVGESFFMIPGAMAPETYTAQQLNNPALYKAVMMGGDLSQVPAKSYEPSGASLMQWAVADVQTSKDGSGDWTVSWVPRARYNGDFASGFTPYLDPDTVGWSIDILSGTTVKRTIAVPLITSAPWQTVYTAAMQSADGFSAGQTGIDFNIYQLSQSVGRGAVNSSSTGAAPTEI